MYILWFPTRAGHDDIIPWPIGQTQSFAYILVLNPKSFGSPIHYLDSKQVKREKAL